ncbi:MAG: hypothetical protein QOE03_2352 [Micromonosporaceae bacterium]|nr:hypothetical protein [Micromonosporaceae bacterium]
MDQDFVGHLRAQAARYAHHRGYSFVHWRTGELVSDRLSYAELDARAERLARRLTALDMRGRTVLLLYPAGLDFVVAFLACLYARVIAVPVPLPGNSPESRARTALIAQDADATWALSITEHAANLREWTATAGLDVRFLATDVTGDDASQAAAATTEGAGERPGPVADPAATAYLQYTSGSTSQPRGILVTHANLAHNQRSIHSLHGRSTSGAVAGWLPHHHDMGLVGQILHPLYAGLDLYFTAPYTFVKRPVVWPMMISKYGATTTVAPNFGYEWCARQVSEQQMAGLNLTTLVAALTGAEPVRARTLREVTQRWQPHGFNPAALMPVYGLAEATLLVSGSTPGHGARVTRFAAATLQAGQAVADDHDGVELVSCGSPVDLDVRVVDPASRVPLADGAVGEIWIRGASVAHGYANRRDATADTFHARLDNGDGPFLRSGDLGFLHIGELFVTGRIKDMVVINGRNLYPEDIEEAAHVHPACGTTAAFGIDVDGEHIIVVQEVTNRQLAGCGLPELSRSVLSAVVRQCEVASASVVLVRRGAVDKTTSGKVRRASMRQRFLRRDLKPLHLELAAKVGQLWADPSTASDPAHR